MPSLRATAAQITSHASHWRTAATEALASDQPLLVVLGDSLAQGVGADDPSRGWAEGLRARLSCDGELAVVNLSRSGARMADVCNTQLPALARIPASRIALPLYGETKTKNKEKQTKEGKRGNNREIQTITRKYEQL